MSASARPSAQSGLLREVAIPCLGIAVVVALAYLPALGAGFIWDDAGHVTRMDLRSLHGLWRIWFEIGATQQYYPVLHSAFWVEHRLWGDLAWGYHALNLALHAAAACLLARVLRIAWADAVPAGAEWAAAALYALHPVCVESVAWVSEQKNTLSAVFCLGSAWCYLRADARRDSGVEESAWSAPYAVASVLFLLALFTKTVTAVLPGALVVIAWWRRGKLSWRRDWVPLLPWLAAGAGAGALTAWVERAFIGARGAQFSLTWGERLALSGRIVCFYAGKLAWPHPLIFIYRHWQVRADSLAAWAGTAALAACILAAWLARKRSRGPLAALLLFVGALAPALGFVDVYPFVFSYVADHFQYLAAAAAISSVCTWMFSALPKRVAWALAAIAGMGWGVLSWRQCREYASERVLYEQTLRRNPDCWLAHDNLGALLAQQGSWDQALDHYRAAAALQPAYPHAFNNLGNALAHFGKWDEAFEAYAHAVSLWPGFAEAQCDWGIALNDAGRYVQARPHFEAALTLNPGLVLAEYGLGNSLANQGMLPEASLHYRRAIQIDPGCAEAWANLGLALARAGDPAAAVEQFRQALVLKPGDRDTEYQLALTLRSLGRFDEAQRLLEAAQAAGP